MDALVQSLKTLLESTDAERFRVISVTTPTGESTTFQTYDQLLKAYEKALEISARQKSGNWGPIRLGRGSRR